MASEILKIDANNKVVAGFVTDDSNQEIRNARIDDTTKGLKVMLVGGTGTGTVTSITAGTGLTATATNPITSSGTISLDSKLSPMDTLTGNALKFLRVNAGETAVEYATPSANLTVGTSTITGGTNTRILYDNSGVLGEYSVIPVSLGGTNATSASITAFNNITGYTASGATGTTSTNLVFSTSPTLVTPTLGVASATSINKVAITAPATSATLTIADGKTFTCNDNVTVGTGGLVLGNSGGLTCASSKVLTVNKSLTLDGTDSTTMTFPSTSATIARTDSAQTFTGTQTFSQVITTANAITASGNAATIPVTSRHNIVTNNSAATLTITLTTTSAVNMQTCVVQILDFSAVAQTITWVNTENSTVSVPTTSNGSTTLPLTVGFIYNSATSKWRCVASA